MTLSETSSWIVPDYKISFWNGKTSQYCIVIPVINEGERIKNLLIKMSLLHIHKIADIIIIDGGSTDGSLETPMLTENHVSGLIVKTGPGKLSAQLRCAYAFAAKNDYAGIITIDGNDKDDPVAIPSFIEKLKEGYDFIQASRFIKGGISENIPPLRYLAIKFIHAPALRWSSGHPWTDTTQGFRAYSKKLLMDSRMALFRDVFQKYELLVYLSYRAPKLKFKCIEIPTSRRYPKDGAIPTKISSISGNLNLLLTLIKACLGYYNPKQELHS